jgi:hypothetical protein
MYSDDVRAPHPALRATLSPLRGARDLGRESFAPRQRGEGGRRPDEGRPMRIAAAFLILLAACGKSDVETTDTRESIATQYVGVADLPVHSQPADITPVITHYKHGESISVLSHKREWAEVRTATGNGWVHQKDLVSAEEAASSKDNPNPKFEHPPSPVTAPSAHGTIYIEADVNTDGEVTNTILITNTTGSPDLAEKNAEALKRSKFYPIMIRGERKPFKYDYRVDY